MADPVRRHAAARRRTADAIAAALAAGLAAAVTACGASAPVVVDPVASTPASSAPASSRSAAGGPLVPADWQFADVPAWVPPRPGDCPQLSEVFDPAASTPPADLDRQRATVRHVTGMSGPGWAVRYARPTALGVVALVRGDLGAARSALTPLGVWQVRSSDGPSGSSGGSPEGRVEEVFQDLLEPVAQRLEQQLSSRAGFAGVSLWEDQGAVLLAWRSPVPADISALARAAHPDGVRVIVEPTAYSLADIETAQRKVLPGGPRIGDSRVSLITACGDDSGLIVGITPATWPRDPDAVRAQLAARAGMPVTLIRQGAAVGTGGSATSAAGDGGAGDGDSGGR